MNEPCSPDGAQRNPGTVFRQPPRPPKVATKGGTRPGPPGAGGFWGAGGRGERHCAAAAAPPRGAGGKALGGRAQQRGRREGGVEGGGEVGTGIGEWEKAIQIDIRWGAPRYGTHHGPRQSACSAQAGCHSRRPHERVTSLRRRLAVFYHDRVCFLVSDPVGQGIVETSTSADRKRHRVREANLGILSSASGCNSSRRTPRCARVAVMISTLSNAVPGELVSIHMLLCRRWRSSRLPF